MEVKEFPLDQLVFTLLCMLLGDEHTDWCYYQFDARWWESRLYMRQN